jgi:PhnB protein
MAINVYINFDGNCREAVEFYANIFETEPTQLMTYGEIPPDPNFVLPEQAKNLIMHTRLNLSDSVVMFSDVFPGSPFISGNNISLAVVSKNQDEIKSLFNKLKEDGTVGMEIQKTFWSDCYGSLTDKFGIEWQLSCDNNNIEV